MKPIHFPVIALLPFLFISCGKKSAGKTAESPAAEATTEGIVLARKDFLPAVGTVVTTVASMDMEDAVMKVKAGPQEMEGTATQKSSGKETLEILSPEKLRRNVISKKNSGKMSINGNEQPADDKTDPLEGIPVIVERKGGTWTAALESGDKPDAAQQKGLDKMVDEIVRNSDLQMYGAAPRKVGDKWEVDPSKLMNFGEAEQITGTYSVEFVSVEDFQGTKCAVLKGIFEIKGKTVSEGNAPPMDLHFKGQAMSRRSIADMQDLDVEVDGTMAINGSPAPNVELEVKGPARITQKTSLGKK